MGRRAVAVIVSMWVIPISILVNRIVPDPYMDEVFHIPQAQQYCNGNFRSWDPMITTPPGLYYLSLAYIASFSPGMWFTKAASSFNELCSIPILRSANGALAVICSVLTYDILIHLKPTLNETRATLFSILIALYPVHWFFTFLYYTDVASVTAVLATLFASLKQHYWLSAMLGGLAVLIRQTNIVWMGFIAATAAIDYADTLYRQQNVQLNGPNISITNKSGIIGKGTQEGPKLRRRRLESSDHQNSSTISVLKNRPDSDKLGIIDEVQDIFLKLWSMKWNILASFVPFFIVLLSFMIFVLWNGSIVLGAKEAHVVSPHFPQILYVGLVSAVAIAPVHFSISQATFMLKLCSKNKIKCLLQLIMVLITGFNMVHFFSIAHPYLIADNRHYTFYIWRKIINRHWTMKYLLVPIYIYSWFSITSILGKCQKKIWILLFFLACAAVLVPAPLIEFRYYTIPFIFLILHSQIEENVNLVLLLVLYVAVDIFTIVMFLCRPFRWSHEPGTQRFIW